MVTQIGHTGIGTLYDRQRYALTAIGSYHAFSLLLLFTYLGQVLYLIYTVAYLDIYVLNILTGNNH